MFRLLQRIVVVLYTGCSRNLDKFGTSLCCNKYVAPNVTGVIRYKVNILAHKLGEHVPCRTMLATTATIVTYVVFNREMTKLTKQDAAALALEGVQFLVLHFI
ncbi:hypothetical protein Bca52824_038846 [Brassica carinata]|uniref:Uncharacterized protein n=1 Tax=Brassica carinata TaxID=52824 RepID=A0A8X7RQE2_BRACI|nr:hypothetical protein Bca52824_038846 [Brassica carinata]